MHLLSLPQEEQLEAILSAAFQTGSLEILTGCIKHWTSEEQPSSAANLRFVLQWTWNKVIYTKAEFDQICVPLFDGSCNFTDPQALQALQRCQLHLRSLRTVLNCFLTEAQELTEKGFADLTNKHMVISLISLYAQVVAWFCRSSLLPEGLDDDMRLSRPFYNYLLIQSYYTGHRQKLERLSREFLGFLFGTPLINEQGLASICHLTQKCLPPGGAAAGWRGERLTPLTPPGPRARNDRSGRPASGPRAPPLWGARGVSWACPRGCAAAWRCAGAEAPLAMAAGGDGAGERPYELVVFGASGFTGQFVRACVHDGTWKSAVYGLADQGNLRKLRKKIGYAPVPTIYLLLDIKHSFPTKTETSTDSFPKAFAIPWGLVKLIQGFWLLDHNDYESALALLFHPATIKSVSWQHMRVLQSLMCQGEHRRALRYIQMMKPPVSSSSEVRLFLTVLLSNRCLVEAWGLLQQHTTKLNMEELLKHMYEICQEMGLMEDLLKLPFTETEQECLEKFLQTNAGVQSREFLLVHHLQRANYIPALQLHQSMKVNPTNDCDLQLRDKAVVRNAVLDQYGKILPRVQRKLAAERAELYHLPSSVLREVSRPKPLSTVTKANAGNVCIFIGYVLSKIREVWVGNEQKPSFSRYDSPRVTEPPVLTQPFPDAELPGAFIGTPATKFSQKCSRLLHSVVHPVPSCSAAQGGCWQSPCGASASFMASSPLKSNLHSSISQRNFSGSTQLNLLETPPVVKVCNLRKLEEQSKPKACQLHLK
nr:protein ELYS [Columba livia]